jgi:hypothetical protein
MAPSAAGRTVRLAAALTGPRTDTGLALAQGAICLEQAAAIVDAVAGVAAHAGTDEQRQVEGFLLEQAHALNAAQLRRLDKVLDAVFDPDGPAPREELARARRAAHLTDNDDGTKTLTWRDTDQTMAKVRAALDPLCAPAPADTRCPAQRRADALAELVERTLRFGDLPASRGCPTQLQVTINSEDLRTGIGFGVTASGELLSATCVQRLACDATVTPIRLDEAGVPLSVGRTRRVVTPAIWKALVVPDGGCVFADCTRPAAWTEAHHIVHWSAGGETELDNTALLCGVHHEALHERGWIIRMASDRRPELVPPRWIDPDHRPRRNEHWRILRRGLHSAGP